MNPATRRTGYRPSRTASKVGRGGHLGKRWSVVFLALLGLMFLPGCSSPIDAYKGAPLPDDEVATVLGGGFPKLHSIDDLPITSDPIIGSPDARVPAGAHTLVIDYQPCFNANSCGLAAATAEVVLQRQSAYGIHHVAEGCSAWNALTSFVRERAAPCRNYLWIADQASGETVWGEAPATGAD
jgi:hypothetical protein